MSWTIAIGEPGPGLLALVGDYPLVPPDQADITLWPAHRHRAIPVGPSLAVIDLRHRDPADPTDLQGADLLLVASATAYGAWAVRAGSIPLAVIPPIALPAATASTGLTALHILADAYSQTEATQAADWAALHGIDHGQDPRTPPIGPGAVILDLRAGAARIDPSPTVLALLAAGAPLLFTEDTPLRLTLETAGAAHRCDTIPAGLADLAAWTPAAFERASAAALRFVATRFAPATAAAAFERAIDAALARPPRTHPSSGQILVVSDEAPNLRHIRVTQPFDALRRTGAITGYTTLSHGQFTPALTPTTTFQAIWVQRSVDPVIQLLLRILDRPFVYDLDDNLLLSPSYRRPFTPETIAVTQALIRDSAILSCATPHLADAVPTPRKAIVTPNLAYAPPVRTSGIPHTIVWASSDNPALSTSRLEIERAVRDFCRTHGLDLLCIGAPPPDIFAAAGLRVEHVPLLPYPDYLARLRAAAPGILVAPLETAGDPATQAFVDAKSDIKIIEAAQTGLVGVFSRALPYAQSDLRPEILCDNDYASWTEGLTRARLDCLSPNLRPWPPRRAATQTGLRPWAEALRRAPTDLSAADLTAALRFVHAQTETLLSAPTLFDEADYCRRHPDVAAAIAAGDLPSAYRHFVDYGFREGRAAQRLATPASQASFWWSRLLHETSTLEATIAARDRRIASLQTRLAPTPPATPPSTPPWATQNDPCPICTDPGQHVVVLSPAGKALLRCDPCGTHFYTDRTEHDYAATPDPAGTILQFTLEQNASIHHQTRLLFGGRPAASVLDVGCGFGFAVDLAATVLGWRAVGIDPSAAAAAGRQQLGADIRQELLTPTADLGPPFDRVIASEILEHVADPHALLTLLRARLARGGTLALTTPNAAAIQPGADQGRLLGILAPGIHLTIFTERSLTLALTQAGFTHIAIEATPDTLIAQASDVPLQPADLQAHAAAYRTYLEHLLDRATPATPLWNGAAGRLLTLLLPTENRPTLDALFSRIATAWHDRFGLDLVTPDLPAPLSQAGIRTLDAHSLGHRHPFNLATILAARADMADRFGTPEDTLRWATPAYRIAVETRRILQAENLVDLDLKRTAWRTRLLILRCLAHQCPDVATTLMQAAATASPGRQADWDDAPDNAIIALLAPFYTAAIAADRLDEARRLHPWLADRDRIATALSHDQSLLHQTLQAHHRLTAE